MFPFKGLHTALVTPFDHNDEIDKEAWEKHLDYQIKGGVDGLVICGTTGESPNISDEEFEYLVSSAFEKANNDVTIIAGSGSNSTKKSIERSERAAELGAKALLLVGPYYNKPTQEGLLAHYRAIADSTDLPCIVYNVPGRTSSNITPQTIAELAKHERIVAVKEACGDINQIMDLVASVPYGFSILSGDDGMTLPIIAAGGVGLISVASNQAPALMKKYVDACNNGDFETARELHYRLYPLMKANFWESNPAPAKASLEIMGMMKNYVRLPLLPMSKKYEEMLRQLLLDLDLIED